MFLGATNTNSYLDVISENSGIKVGKRKASERAVQVEAEIEVLYRLQEENAFWGQPEPTREAVTGPSESKEEPVTMPIRKQWQLLKR